MPKTRYLVKQTHFDSRQGMHHASGAQDVANKPGTALECTCGSYEGPEGSLWMDGGQQDLKVSLWRQGRHDCLLSIPSWPAEPPFVYQDPSRPQLNLLHVYDRNQATKQRCRSIKSLTWW